MYSKNMVGWTKAQKLRIERVLALGCAICGHDNHGSKLERPVTLVDGSKLFVQAYGSRRSLWEATQRRLGLPCDWPVSKIVQRMPLRRDWA